MRAVSARRTEGKENILKRIGFLTWPAIVAVLLWAAPAGAQLSMGVAAGGTYSNLGGSLISNTESDWGVLLGGSAFYRFQANAGLALEGNWVQKGGHGSTDEGSIDVDVDYFELPLTLHLVVELGAQWDWNLYGGIGLAFKTQCSVSLDPGEKQSCDDSPLGWTFQSTEWSLPFGSNVTHRFRHSALTADLRYSYGLSALVVSPEFKNRSWQFIVRWGFQI